MCRDNLILDRDPGFVDAAAMNFQLREDSPVFDKINGFQDIIWHAARAARQNGIGVDPSTAGNMLSLGIEPDKETRRPV